MTKSHAIRIETAVPAGLDGTRVFVDGNEIHKVVLIEFRHMTGELPQVVLYLYADEITIEGEAVVTKEPINGIPAAGPGHQGP